MADDDECRTPAVSYRDDPKRADTHVLVELNVPGLKKKLIGSKASNANIVFEPKQMSFSITITLQGKGNPIKYHYSVKKLPNSINTDIKMTKYQVKDNRVDIYLAKETAGSWDNILQSTGLEQDN